MISQSKLYKSVVLVGVFTLLSLQIYGDANIFPQDTLSNSNWPQGSTSSFAGLCIDITPDEIEDFDISVNGSTYLGQFLGCQYSRIGDYNLANSSDATFSNCSDFSVIQWTIDGSDFGPFNFTTFSELTAWMNTVDPNGNWNFDGSNSIGGGSATTDYGDLEIRSNCNLGVAQLRYNEDLFPQATQIDVDPSTNVWVTVESKNDANCIDSVFLCFTCADPCELFIEEQTCLETGTGSTDDTAGLCIQIAPSEIAEYRVWVGTNEYSGTLIGCDLTRVADYNIFNSTNASFRSCNDYQVRSWLIDDIEQGPIDFTTFEELTTWMNTQDPTGNWAYDGSFSIAGGDANTTYGKLEILAKCNLGVSEIGYNVDLIPAATMIDLQGPNCQWIVIEEISGSMCVDSIYVCIDCIAPIAVADSITTDINSAVEIEVLPNDSDPDNQNLEVCELVSQPNDGQATIINGTSISFTPDNDFTGISTFDYILCNAQGQKDTATVTVTIRPPCNEIFSQETEELTCDNQEATVKYCLPIAGNDFDNYEIFDNNNIYSGDFNACDLQTVSDYNLQNSLGASFQSCADYRLSSWIVDGSEFGPVDFATFVELATWMNAQDPAGNWSFDGTSSIDGGDENKNYGNLTIISNCNLGVATVAFNTDVVANGIEIELDSSLDHMIKVVPKDPLACADSIQLNITCDLNTPVAVDDAYETAVNQVLTSNVIANDSDPANSPLTVSLPILTTVTNGTLDMNADGSFTYTPNVDFIGPDEFSYIICNAENACDTAIVSIEVKQPLKANGDQFTTAVDTAVTSNVTNNDTGDSLVVKLPLVKEPNNGTVTIDSTGNFTYTPNLGFSGGDSFIYEICSASDTTVRSDAQVLFQVGVTPPVAVDDNPPPMSLGGVLMGNVLTNDFDPNDRVLTITPTPIVLPQSGTVVLNSDGTYSYTPNDGFSGTDTFEYEVCNDLNSCDTAMVTIVVQLNLAPIAVDDNPAPIEKNTSLTDNVLTNDSDPNNLPLAVDQTLVELPSNGVVLINTDGNYTYTPNAEFIGTDTFQYRVCNNTTPVQCDTALVTIIVTGESAKITIYQALSPNQDGLNDTFVIDGIEQFPNNSVKIFNRWGNLVWIGDRYNNNNILWRGTSNQGIINFGNNDLPDGTYYYVIELGDGSIDLFTGFLELKR